MTRIGVRELRQHASRYLDLVKTGEPVEITERGELVARLVPPEASEPDLDRYIADGSLLPAKRGRRLPTPVPARPGDPDSSEVLDELREERL